VASLASAANVYNTCLRILRRRGYKLWVDCFTEADVGPEDCSITWRAEKDGYDFAADDPLELLGLTAIYEFKKPTEAPAPYWWVVEGEKIHDELLLEENLNIIPEGE
jgi:hypothetical protein